MSDSTPQDPKHEAGKSEEPAAGVWLPPRLREKLQEGASPAAGDDWSPKRQSPIPTIIMAVLFLALGAGGVAWWRSSSAKSKAKEVAAAAAVAAQERADSLAAVAHAESLKAFRDSTALATASGLPPTSGPSGLKHPATPPATKPATSTPATAATTKPATSAPAPAPATTPPAPSTEYGIMVGSFLFEDKANSERDRLSGLTGLPGIVNPQTSGGSPGFAVIIGNFPSRSLATKKAAALVDSSVVTEAHVVTRPK